MSIGIGGSTVELELEKLQDMTQQVQPITVEEFQQRIDKAQQLMRQQHIAAMYLNAGTNLYYFTGTKWYASERMVAAILPQQGELIYIAPHFELNTLEQYMQVKGEVITWQEHQSPYALCAEQLHKLTLDHRRIAIDEATPFFISNGIRELCAELEFIDAKPITAGCRMQKSPMELALLQQAKNMTLAVHKAAAKILYPGISTQQVSAFIDAAHRKVGAKAGSYFCIVLFGEDTAFPHGVKHPKPLAQHDMVLIDTGCQLEGYNSDITRSYVFGHASTRQRTMWQIEKSAQLAAFNAAQLGAPCGAADIAARNYLASQGLGPDYQTPGCPHRTGHGIGLDIHEWPYLVRSEQTLLAEGMCFSNEPMLVIPNEFGVRLEDHFYLTAQGPQWFTEPSYSIDDPFGYQQ
jgi:Xaa-Pro dipeptidase